eukprot:TRINITY_DN71012_c0_g1_i1.p1 TRINITY_DN71012_c0_g1~~TRINITY_DN71012_c0_g1_i1.p1  ORF type:complete len:333 (+),score=110.06 TRINITY_DN71012_c0_g1_i1:62-1000(+)
MAGRRIEAFGLGEDACRRLRAHGYKSSLDVLLASPEQFAVALDRTVKEAAELQMVVARRLVPERLTLSVSGFTVPTGMPTLDKALHGGLPVQMLVEAAGPPGSGKTQLCLTTAALCAADGHRVVYADTEGKFSTERLAEVLFSRGLPPEAAGAVEVLRIGSAAELADLPGELELRLHEAPARLVVIDSVAARIVPEPMSAPERSEFVARLASQLKEIAFRCNAAFLVTNHAAGRRADSGALGNTWHHAVNVRLALRAEADISLCSTHPRELCVAKSPMSANVVVPYAIMPQGVVEVSGPAQYPLPTPLPSAP